jgi:ABC-type polysaccharide/polyol phosphate transport system ATPase subunit
MNSNILILVEIFNGGEAAFKYKATTRMKTMTEKSKYHHHCFTRHAVGKVIM